MGNVALVAQAGESERILDGGNRLRRISEEPPSLRDLREQMRPILESGATHEATRLLVRRERFEGTEQRHLIHATRQPVCEPHMGARGGKRIAIAEEIRDQRRIAGTSRRGGKRAAGCGGDQDRAHVIARSRARA